MVQQFIKKNWLKLINYLTNFSVGVMTCLMHLSELKIFNKLPRLKSSYIKVGILMSLLAYWGVILVGTFVTFN